jgi:sigma-B regulation protein RsbU (phosphoserine phosphatase)
MAKRHRQESRTSMKALGKTVLHDIRHERVDRSFVRDMQDIYAFYIDEDGRAHLAKMGRIKRYLTLSWWLLHMTIRRLSPPRRLLLLLGLIAYGYGMARGFNQLGHLHLLTLASLLVFIVLMLELKDKLVARDELQVGRMVQLALLPNCDPRLPGWDISLFSRPANDVGGDLVDYLELPGNRMGLVLGDVAGKGLGAALLMAKLQATLRAVVRHVDSLEQLGATTNRIFLQDGVPGRFATMAYLEIAANSGEVRMLNAGHEPPLLLRRDGIDQHNPVAMPLGLLPDAAYSEQRCIVDPGDYLVLCSDGVTEAQDKKGEPFDADRLREAVQTVRGCDARTMVEALHQAVGDFIGDRHPGDDLSIIVLRRTG